MLTRLLMQRRSVFLIFSCVPDYFFFFTSAVHCGVNPSLTGIILEELADFLEKRGAHSYRAKQITDWIYKKRVASFDAMTDLPSELRAQLTAEFDTPKT